MKHYNILQKELDRLRRDSTIEGVLLTVSIAYGDASDTSDLDLIILCDKDGFTSKTVEGILVENIYRTYETARKKLENSSMDLYRYLDAKIQFDNGKLAELMNIAENKYTAYQTDSKSKKGLRHWLYCTDMKLKTAVGNKDRLKTQYIVSTNSGTLLEAVWSVNNKSIPPSGTVFGYYTKLETVPFDNWFSLLFSENADIRVSTMLRMIEWVIPLL